MSILYIFLAMPIAVLTRCNCQRTVRKTILPGTVAIRKVLEIRVTDNVIKNYNFLMNRKEITPANAATQLLKAEEFIQ